MPNKFYADLFEQETVGWRYIGLQDLVEKVIKLIFKDRTDIKILDAGCGTGRMIDILSKKYDVEGFDVSPEAITFCRKRGIEKVWVQDINEWQPEPEKYDVILSLDVLSQEQINNPLEILKKLNVALIKNGYLILHLPAFESIRTKWDETALIKKRWEKSEIRKMLHQASFDIEFMSYRLSFLYLFLWFRKKIFRRKSEIKNAKEDLNEFLLKLVQLENKLLLSGLSLPFGSSIFVVAKKV